jgi:SAM-dependent methyltransferase
MKIVREIFMVWESIKLSQPLKLHKEVLNPAFGGMKFLANPLFIIKELQRRKIKKYSSFLKGDVLDIGCGTKPYKNYIAYARYIGIDGAVNVRPDAQARSEELPFKTGYFDGVMCTEVLEHLKEPEKCVSEIHRVLKTGGYVYITVPQSWGLHYEPCDYWRFTRYGMEYLVKKYDFEIIGIEKIGGFFSSNGQQLIDFLWGRLAGFFSFLGNTWAERFASAACAPFSLVCYLLAVIGDGSDNRFAIGWVIVGKKR